MAYFEKSFTTTSPCDWLKFFMQYLLCACLPEIISTLCLLHNDSQILQQRVSKVYYTRKRASNNACTVRQWNSLHSS